MGSLVIKVLVKAAFRDGKSGGCYRYSSKPFICCAGVSVIESPAIRTSAISYKVRQNDPALCMHRINPVQGWLAMCRRRWCPGKRSFDSGK